MNATAIRNDLRLATVTSKGCRIWDGTGGGPLRFVPHGAWSRTVEWTGENTLALPDQTGAILLLSEDGTLRRRVSTQLVRVSKLNLHNTSQRALMVRSDNSVSVWSSRDHRVERRISDVYGPARFSPDGQRVALIEETSGGKKRGTAIVDLSSGRTVSQLTSWARRFAWSPDGRHLLTGTLGLHNRAQLWDVATGNLVRSFQGQRYINDSHAIPFFVEGRRITVAGGDDVELWDRSGRHLKSFESMNRFIHCAALSPDGQWLACGASKLEIYALNSGERAFAAAGSPIRAIEFGSDGKSILTGHHNGEIMEGSLTVQKRRLISGSGARVESISLGRNGRLWTTHDDGIVRIRDMKSGQLLVRLAFLWNSNDWVAVIPDGRLDGTPAGLAAVVWRTRRGLLTPAAERQQTLRATRPGLLRSLGEL